MEMLEFLPPGSPIDLDNCAREPIHLPGSIQPKGVLLCARAEDRVMVQRSVNTEALFGPEQLIGRSLDDLLGSANVDQLVARSRQTPTPNLRPLRIAIARSGPSGEGATAVPLEPVVNPVTAEWLDLSQGVLRGVSPMHIQYLQNMGVRASMSISLVVEGRLWGLISVHHYSDRRHVPHTVRAACEFVGLVTSMQLADKAELEAFDYRLDLEGRQQALLEQVAAAASIASGLVANEEDLLAVGGAAGAAVRIGAELHLVGRTPPRDEIERLINILSAREDSEPLATDCAAELFDPAPEVETAAGILAVPLSRLHGNYMLWFRPEWPHTVTWGDSDTPVVVEEGGWFDDCSHYKLLLQRLAVLHDHLGRHRWV